MMKSACLSLGFDDAGLEPIHATLCNSPCLDRELILGGQANDGVETITSFVYGELDPYVACLDGLDTVLEYDVTPAEDGFFVYLRRELGPDGESLLDALAQETVVVVPPIEIRSDRTIQLTVVGHSRDLSGVIETLGDEITIDVLWTSDRVTVAEPLVSERQRVALEVAWELGYYEVPRANGIEAVAHELNCAVSTASALLRRGEAKLVSNQLEQRH